MRVSYETTQPQLFIRVDRERASDLGIDIDGLGEALQAVLDGTRVGSVFIDDRSYDVKLTSLTTPVSDPTDLENLFLATAVGEMVPMSRWSPWRSGRSHPSFTRESADALGHDHRLALRRDGAGAGVRGGAGSGGAAAAAGLPDRAPRRGGDAGRDLERPLVTFGFAILLVFLVLAAQFESFVKRVIVMATVPLGLGCAVVAMVLTGTSLNVYSQIGLVLLVGIIAKNGILVVEFANQLRDHGAGVREAIEEACRIRLRPVMMTMICDDPRRGAPGPGVGRRRGGAERSAG